MLVKLRCKSCFTKVAADDDVLGKEVNCPSCNARFFIPIPQFGFGKVLGGYEIEQFLGSGAMGEVYMARQVSMNRPVALKVIKHDISMDTEVVQRFSHEAQTLARLNHPNIVPAFDAGHTDECYYMAMGYIDGETLEDKLKRSGSMDELELLKISLKVIDALEYAWNEFKLLHRDIKPANIMIDQMGEVRIMDMGIAKNTMEDGGLTQAGMVVGTPFFMSPEQAQASTGIDFRSDVYALAATMYHMITGVLPFQGPNVMAILAKKVNSPIIPPHEIKPYVTEETSALILRLLYYHATKRFEDFKELRQMMDACLKAAQKNKDKADNTAKTKYIKVPDEVLQAAKTEIMAKSQNVRAMKKKESKKLVLLISLLGVIILLLLALLVLPSKKSPVVEEQAKPSVEKVEKTAVVNRQVLTEMFADVKAEDQEVKNKFSKLSNKDFFHQKQQYVVRTRGRFGLDTLKTRGEVSRDKFGAMALTKGVYFDNEIKTEVHGSLQEKDGFCFHLVFMTNENQQSDGVVFCYGRDAIEFNLKIETRGNDIYLITRQYFSKKPKVREQKLFTIQKEVCRLFVSYRSGQLLVFRNTQKVAEFKDYSGLMDDWLTFPISFGDHLKGEHKYWSGSIYNFVLFNAFADEKRVSEINNLLNRKLDKVGKKFKR